SLIIISGGLPVNQIYKRNSFIIVPFFKGKNKKEFMIINLEKKKLEGFKKSHTHIKSFKMGKYLINLAITKKINSGLSPYLLTSLKRISNDDKHISDIEDLIKTKRNKKKL